MKRFLPDSLPAWALLILIAGLVATQISTLVVIAQSREGAARMNGFFQLARRVSSVTRAVATADAESRPALAEALSDPTLSVRVEATGLATKPVPEDDELAELQDILEARLTDVGITDIHVERQVEVGREPAKLLGFDSPDEDAGPVERVLSDIEARYVRNGSYVASVAMPDGFWLNFTMSMPPGASVWSPRTIAIAGLALSVVLVASIISLRRLTMPYETLAAAAERIGRDLNSPQLPEKGPRELRSAAHAFNLMQNRLQRVVADRDQLVAAISHDLRTPITRLRLRADFIDDVEQRGRMVADLDEIESMTRSILAFARDNAVPEARETLDLFSFLEVLCDDSPATTLTLPPERPPRFAYVAHPVGLKRCIANLIDNAVKYGGQASVSLDLGPRSVAIHVDDDGPGIPEWEMDAVFKPFRRLETSRSRETGGTGLGLTIARMVARAHGGDVRLINRAKGGLRAELFLPLPSTVPVVPA